MESLKIEYEIKDCKRLKHGQLIVWDKDDDYTTPVFRKALEAVQAGPEGLPIMGHALLDASTWVDNRADGAVTTLRSGLDSRWDRAEKGLNKRAERTQVSRTAIRIHLAGMFDHLGNRDIGEAGTEFYAALKAGNTAWTIWWDEDGNGP